MTSGTIRRVIILGAIAILSLIFVQAYWLYQTYMIQEREFDRKVNQALLDVTKDLKRHYNLTLPSQKLVEQVSTNYFVVNVNDLFDESVLEYYLRLELENQALKESFQYGIFDCSSNQMVAGKTIKYLKNPVEISPGEQLPAHRDDDFIYYFGVRFPDRAANILSNIWLVLLFTVLMLITLAFFIYSMFVILRQKQLSEQQRDFINNMTHEFKTPISTINISTDVFLQNATIQEDPRLNRYAGIIKEQALRLNTQVENVLQMARVERGDVELKYERIDLPELLQNISPSLEIKVAEKQGTLSINLDTVDAVIKADRMHLTNIIHNLVDNGVKYSEEHPKIIISLKESQNHKKVVLRICDNGVGISEEHQKRVFDKFYRVPTGNIHDVKGFGLGLFYVKRMCKEHSWTLSVNSAPKEGTCMLIEIPKQA